MEDVGAAASNASVGFKKKHTRRRTAGPEPKMRSGLAALLELLFFFVMWQRHFSANHNIIKKSKTRSGKTRKTLATPIEVR